MDSINEALLEKALQSTTPPPELPAIHSKLPNGSESLTWREAAKRVNLDPSLSCIEEFERQVLPSIRTLSSEFDCELCPQCNRPMLSAVIGRHIKECEARSRMQSQEPNGRLKSKLDEDGMSSSKGLDETSDSDEMVKSSNGRSNGHSLNGSANGRLNGTDAKNAINGKIKFESNGSNGTRNGSDDTAGAKSGSRKRINEDNAANSAAKKKAKTARNKATRIAKPVKPTKERVAAPFNPDKQCGVPLPNGQQCQRSLTCKAHSMGAKRQVPGRSAPYDILLGQYQRQSQIKQAQLSATQAATLAESDQQLEAQAQMNPEKEVQQVLEGVRRVYCASLDRKVMMPSRLRTNNFRLREMLALALLPKGLSPAGDSLFGRSLIFSPETPQNVQYLRAPAVQRAMYLAGLQQQRQMQQQHQQQAHMVHQQHLGQSERPLDSRQPNLSMHTTQAQLQAQTRSRTQADAQSAQGQSQSQNNARNQSSENGRYPASS